MARVPVDRLLVERGLAPDLARARALVLAGQVVAGERRVDKPGDRVPADTPLRLKEPAHPYVSRGGVKLAAALDAWHLDVRDQIALDLGASTGGFTDVLLRRGARRVYAVDVGYGQLAWKLQQDPRVVNLERTRADDLDEAKVPEPVDLLVADVSFTSLTRVVPGAAARLTPQATMVLLVKPQFEAPREAVEPGGLVRDPVVRRAAWDRVAAMVAALGFAPWPPLDSPLPGADGNRELLLGARRVSPGPTRGPGTP